MGIAAYRAMATVHLSRGFWLGQTEVTQSQWQAVMGANPSKFKGQGMEAPVDSVSWVEAMDFCRRITDREKTLGRVPAGYEYRLPTEAEWEYACRSGTKTTGEVNGNGVLADVAWFADNSAGQPHTVATRRANEWGFYDMLGNVSEWCYDWLGAAIHGEVTDPAGASFGTLRVTRGGNWSAIADHMALSHRLWQDPGARGAKLGFRVALAPHISPPAPPSSQWVRIPPGPSAPADAVGKNRAAGTTGIELVWVPPGSFGMVEPRSPVTVKVHISRGFWLGRTEVTQAQWQAVMGNNPSHVRNEGSDAPVDGVSWNDAGEFCRRVNKEERATGHLPPGYEYRLPTEAEWEYACRAGTTGDISGNGRIGDMGWYGENSGGHTHPVARKQPNAWGLYDMHGNLWEPVYDRFGIYPEGEVTDPAGVWAGTLRSSRGGCWESADDTSASGHRTANAEDFSSNHTGMRLALAPRISP